MRYNNVAYGDELFREQLPLRAATSASRLSLAAAKPDTMMYFVNCRPGRHFNARCSIAHIYPEQP
ncbi:hypothetical protein P4S72_19665 [Vibrio sp. PP-XX7]